MEDYGRNDREADAINDLMVQQMEQRRQERVERRTQSRSPTVERRTICSYCFQRGDHPTAAHCLRALERAS
jgi:hypothetical protein